MRKIFIAAIVAFFTISIAPAASAQNLGGILNAVSGSRYNSCGYLSGGYQTLCQVERVTRITDDLRRSSDRQNSRKREKFEQQARAIQALQRACKAGDQVSCDRLGGIDPRNIEIGRALMEACQAGDDYSCNRATAVMTNKERGYNPQVANSYRPSAPASNNAARPSGTRPMQIGSCTVDVSNQTGYRVGAPYNCR